MTDSQTEFEHSYKETAFGSGIVQAFKAKPFVLAGVIGMVATCGYGFWRYRTQGSKFKPSVFLLQLRVGAQSVVVGCITLGMIYNMYQTQIVNKKKKD